MNAIALTKHERHQLVQMLNELPPIEYLSHCQTLHQLAYWFELGESYSYLKASFVEFFTGQGDSVLSHLPDPKKEFFFLMRDWYLSFYTLIQGNWQHIISEAKKKECDLSKIPANTPGEALIRVIENDCAAFFCVCTLPYYRWSPSESRKLAKLDRDIELAKTQGLSKKDIATKLNPYQSLLKNKLMPLLPYISFREICLEICSKAKKGSTTHRHYIEYRRIKFALDKKIQSSIHERHKIRGHEWVRGEKRTLSTKGGICYKTSQ
ncbi:hypothetical protein NIES4106_61140 (plasmid) [Fischerella sp. NIES-4106]|nr:hypothetical protein NIES4106_61140 [Fischerella sp. NIES-4106]